MHVLDDEGEVAGVIPAHPSAPWFEFEEETMESSVVDGAVIQVFQESVSNMEVLPEQETGTFYIVPRRVALAAWERGDLCYPCDVERNGDNKIIGCHRFKLA